MEDLLWLVSFADDDDRELTTQDIAIALGMGEIHLGTLLWRDGMQEWRALSEIAELAPVVERHRALAMSLKKRQTALGGFRATDSAGSNSSAPGTLTPSSVPPSSLPSLPAPPPAPSDAHALRPLPPESPTSLAPFPGVPVATLERPSAEELQELASATAEEPTEAEPPTLRPGHDASSYTPPAVAALGGFQPVPVRRRLSSGVSLEELEGLEASATPIPGAATDDATLSPAEVLNRPSSDAAVDTPTRTFQPPDDIPASLDSSAVESLPSVGEASRPSASELGSGEYGAVARGMGARDLDWNPHAEDSATDLERADESVLTARYPTRPPPSVEVMPRPAARTTLPPRNGTPRTTLPPLNRPRTAPERRSAVGSRTIPPRAGVSQHVETVGLSLSEVPQPVLVPRRWSPAKRAFLGIMTALALGSVGFLGLRYFQAGGPEEPQVERVFAARPGSNAEQAPAAALPAQPAAQQVAAEAGSGPQLAAAPPVQNVVQNIQKLEAADPKPQVVAVKSDVGVRKENPGSSTSSFEVASSIPVVGAPHEALKPNPFRTLPASATAEARGQSEPVVGAVGSQVKGADVKGTEGKSTDAKPTDVAAGTEFDRDAAATALEKAASAASACRQPGDPSGVARVSVTFSDSGRATRALVDGPPFAGTATGGCIAEAMRKAQIPAFTGDRVTVRKTVVIQ